MPAEKLYQNRAVVIGRSYDDARKCEARISRDSLDSAVIINAAAHRLTILGTIPNSVATVYVTPDAHEGMNYDVVKEGIEAAKIRNPSMRIFAVGENHAARPVASL